jgi:N-dimethylarginine dimethylaminohydrolase
MVAQMRRVLVKSPDENFAVTDPAAWNYSQVPDLAKAKLEHEGLVRCLERAGAEVVYHNESLPGKADSIFVFDPAIVTNEGAIILRMGKELRRGEEAAMARQLSRAGVPMLGGLVGEATAEGGDLLWLDRNTLVAGVGFRTNSEGCEQLRKLLKPLDVGLMVLDLPFWRGPLACLHLLSLISLVDEDLAVVYPPLLPVRLWLELEKRGYQVLAVPEEEFSSMGTNVLALGPRRCLMLSGNPITERRLVEAGCEVALYEGTQISFIAEGGPTCLTRPLLRES